MRCFVHVESARYAWLGFTAVTADTADVSGPMQGRRVWEGCRERAGNVWAAGHAAARASGAGGGAQGARARLRALQLRPRRDRLAAAAGRPSGLVRFFMPMQACQS